MVLSLTPLIIFVASFVTVAVLLRRRLPRPGEVVGVSCVRCGTPGAALAHDLFVCPGCGRDVREAGLAPARGQSPTLPFWTVTLYTLAVLAVAPITASVAEKAAPRVDGISAEATFSAPRSRAYAGVVVTTTSSGPSTAPREWTSQTLAEVTTLDGRATLLEIERPPGRWRITADDGRMVEQGTALDEEAVLRWYRAAGLDTGDPRVRSEIADVLPNLGELRREPRTVSTPVRVASGLGFDSRGARSGSSTRRATWVGPVVVAGWSVVWMLAVWALLRPARAGATKSTPSVLSVSPGGGGCHAMSTGIGTGSGSGTGLTGPACGRCGYDTTGLASLTCPECGSDLRAVGILTTAASRRLTFPIAAVFTLTWMFAGFLLLGALKRVVPTPKRYSAQAGLDPPRSAAYAGVDLYATGTAWGDERPAVAVVIELRPKAGSPLRGVGRMTLNPETGSYAYLDPTPKQVSAESGFNGQAVAQWLAAAGLDASDPRLRSEANRIAAAARHAGRRPATFADFGGGAARRSVGNDPHFGSISYSAGYSPKPLTWLIVPPLALYVVAWWAGLRYLWRMSRDPAAATAILRG